MTPEPGIAHQRLRTQRLVGAPFARPEEAVRWLGAVQAQDYGGAKWGLGQRLYDATDASLDQAFAAGAILRTHVLRPTWHFVAPEDIRWLLALTAPRVHALNAHYYRQLELDDSLFARATALLAAALRGGNHPTRTEIGHVFDGNGIPARGLRLGYLMMWAELEGLICSGPRRGKQHTYALLDERVPPAPPRDRDDALADLATRYFAGHGPATVQDYAWWSGLTVADATRGIALAGSALAGEGIAGTTYWRGSTAPAVPIPPDAPRVHLLPNYDEYLVAYKNHDPVFDPDLRATATSDHPALQGHILVLDGRVIGGWRRTIRGKRVALEAMPLVPLSDDARGALRDAADRYARFLDLPVDVEG